MKCDRCGCWLQSEADWLLRSIRVTAGGKPGFPRSLWGMREGNYLRHPMFNAPAREACFPTNDAPIGAVKMFLAGFATQDTAALARLMTANYRFRSQDPAFVSRHPHGLDRLAQLDSMAHFPESGISLLCQFPDTSAAHPSEPAFRESRVQFDEFTMTLHSDERQVRLFGPAPCAFVLVRGDSARLGSGQPPDVQRWYVASWSIGAELTSRVAGTVDRGGDQDPTVLPVALGIRRTSPLGEWPIMFDIALPSREAARVLMFDLSGRRVFERRLSVAAPGTRRFVLEDKVAAGVYWLRVLQGGQEAGEEIVAFR